MSLTSNTRQRKAVRSCDPRVPFGYQLLQIDSLYIKFELLRQEIQTKIPILTVSDKMKFSKGVRSPCQILPLTVRGTGLRLWVCQKHVSKLHVHARPLIYEFH